jgi:hypothetical protein
MPHIRVYRLSPIFDLLLAQTVIDTLVGVGGIGGRGTIYLRLGDYL